ncbi:MAG: PilN domain-containing protein [bacterium]|nr:PilN domain-containing protein [bacterium]
MVTRINLLSPEILARKKIRKQVIISMSLVCVVFVIMISFYIHKCHVFAEKKEDLRIKRKELSALQQEIREVERLEAKKAKLEERKGVLEQLVFDRQRLTRILDEMCSCVPFGLWLQSITPKGNQLSISGTAFDNFCIANYMVSLSNSDMFGEVELLSITDGSIFEHPVKRFQLDCDVIQGVSQTQGG